MEKILRVGNAYQKKILARLGYKLTRLKESKTTKNKVYTDPLDSLVLRQLGLKSSFKCPIELCRQETGFGFGTNQWHPFVAALKEYAESNVNKYEGSILQKFYQNWNPQSAAEVLAGFNQAPESFGNFPPYGHYLMPWRVDSSLERMRKDVDHWSARDYQEHEYQQLNMKDDGYKNYGPVSRRLGEFEYNRLVNIYEKIKREGYQRDHGDVGVMMIKDNSDYIFMLRGGGVHRTAALAALGYTTIPATFIVQDYFIDTKYVNYWPQVKSGLWQRDEAIAYIKYLFNFDSCGWAKEMYIAR